ncbi:MAG: hypothetical protein ACW964_00255 [Candidatus Hodarchaeales archaeon]|jgi:hypothetical protein
MKAITKDQRLEEYPIGIVCVSVTITIISYLLGAIVLYLVHPFLGFLFLLLVIFTILVSMKLRCTHCFYLGKYCNFGLGKLAAILFKKGNSKDFNNPRKVIPTAILSFGTILLPIIAGIGLLIINFTLVNLGILLAYLLFGILPNFFVRGNYCDKCMQGQLGCPSYEKMKKGRQK